MAYMTQEGYDSLVAQLRRMEQIDRPAASAAIAEARDKGDLSENAEYDAAKEAQAHLETKINELKATIAAAKIIDTSKLRTDIVQILSTVEMKNVKVGAKMKYTMSRKAKPISAPAKFRAPPPLPKPSSATRWVTSSTHKHPAASSSSRFSTSPSDFPASPFPPHRTGTRHSSNHRKSRRQFHIACGIFFVCPLTSIYCCTAVLQSTISSPL